MNRLSQFPVQGVFTSHYSSDPPAGPINWKLVREAGYAYAMIKASDWIHSDFWIDPAFERDWYEAQLNGLICSPLHFFRPAADPTEQADHFLELILKHGRGQLPPTCNVEIRPPANMDLFASVEEYQTEIIIAHNCRPILYTSPDFWIDYWHELNGFPSWLCWSADWTLWRSAPRIPAGFKRVHFWQWWDRVDLPWAPPKPALIGHACPDRFMGSYEELLKLTYQPSPPLQTWPIDLTLVERDALLSIAEKLLFPQP